jgi:trigger factor
MKVEIEQLAPCVRRLTIEVPTDRVDHELKTVYGNLQKRVKIPGFRQGKVPRTILENYYRQSVEQEVLQKLVPEALSEALIKENVQSVGEPHIDQITLTKDQPLRFVATTQVIPDFSLVDYRGWQFERRIPVVTEVQVEQGLERLRERHAELRTVTGRVVRTHDFVLINYTGSLDGRPLPGAEGTNVLIEVGGGRFLPEIEQDIVGMEAGSTKTIPIVFPVDSRDANVAGKVVQFHVTVVEIKEKVLPGLDDEFAQAYENTDSLEALRARVREEIEAAVRQQADAVLRNDILDRLVEAHTIELPEVLVQEQMRRAYIQQKRLELGRELTEAEAQVDLTTLGDAFAEQAQKTVRGQLILRRIGTEEELRVAPEEVEAEVASLASRAAQNPEALRKAMERNGTLAALEYNVLEQKIFAAILAQVQVTDTMVSEAVSASNT